MSVMVSEIGLLALIQHGIVKQATMAESGIGGGGDNEENNNVDL